MTRKLPHQPLARVLETNAEFAGWTARHREETVLTRLVRKNLPRALGERVRVSDSRNHVLELAAGAGAIAAALRQRVPELRAALAREGHAFGEIRVRVDVAGSLLPPQAPPKPSWDSRAAAPLFDLADQLPPSPLKDALRRWSRRARGR